MSLILTMEQAEAVYSAMCALNNVGMRLDAQRDEVLVYETVRGLVRVVDGDAVERYANQADFATAYGLVSDGPPSDVAAAAGGLTQTAIER